MATAARTQKRRYSMTTRAASTAQTRERVLDATFALVRDHPYEEVTLQRVAEAAGVSMQTVLLHFGSKEGLMNTAIEWFLPQEEAAREVPIGDVELAAKMICKRYQSFGPATLRFLALED